jgi:hypothetical protein
MRKIKVELEVEIGRPSEIGLAMTIAGIEGREADDPAMTYSASPVLSGTGMRFTAQKKGVSYWAKTDFKEMIQTVWEDLASEVQIELLPEEEAVTGD